MCYVYCVCVFIYLFIYGGRFVARVLDLEAREGVVDLALGLPNVTLDIRRGVTDIVYTRPHPSRSTRAEHRLRYRFTIIVTQPGEMTPSVFL